MAHDRPLVSIVLPTYNRERLLRAAIDSVVAQTFSDWELIVLDDGSTDGTADYLAALTDPRVQVIRDSHSGRPGFLRNRGMDHGRGAYVAFIDCDDLWVPTKLARQVADLRDRRRRWGYAHHRWIDDQGEPLPTPAGRQWQHCEGWILRDLLAVRAWVSMPTVIVERSLMDEVGGFDDAYPVVSDYEAWIRLARRAEAALIPEPLAAVRVHEDSLSRRRVIEMHHHLARLYHTLGGDHALREHRALCRQRFVSVSLALADHCRVAGRTARALRAVRESLWVRPLSIRAWMTLAKTVAYPFVPPGLLAAYHRSHTARPDRRSHRA